MPHFPLAPSSGRQSARSVGESRDSFATIQGVGMRTAAIPKVPGPNSGGAGRPGGCGTDGPPALAAAAPSGPRPLAHAAGRALPSWPPPLALLPPGRQRQRPADLSGEPASVAAMSAATATSCRWPFAEAGGSTESEGTRCVTLSCSMASALGSSSQRQFASSSAQLSLQQWPMPWPMGAAGPAGPPCESCAGDLSMATPASRSQVRAQA
mmetsp:Transcript_100778/g.313360  ORF Transcript_100778/g.313360 Transcript_100778/m.313360 type:complete len:210 (+) Transcript_100778:233-862(+)